MENKNIDWRDSKLQNEEVDMLESIENGEWESNGNIEERRNSLRSFFSNIKENEKTINIRLAKEDFDIIQDKSKQFGMNYQELIQKLVHNYVTGKVIL